MILLDIVGPPCAPWCTMQVDGSQCRSLVHNVALSCEVVHNIGPTNTKRPGYIYHVTKKVSASYTLPLQSERTCMCLVRLMVHNADRWRKELSLNQKNKGAAIEMDALKCAQCNSVL